MRDLDLLRGDRGRRLQRRQVHNSALFCAHVDNTNDDDSDDRPDLCRLRQRLAAVWIHGSTREQRAFCDRDLDGDVSLLYVYDPNGGLGIYLPRSGKKLSTLAAAGGHWNSAIIADGRIALPEGDANDHALNGVIDIYRLG